jgi:hypothetical protein
MAAPIALSIIVPTIGRPGLSSLLKQVAAQLGPDDEVLVVGDGIQPEARAQASILDARVKYIEHPNGPCGDWGCKARNWAMPQANGTHLMFLDDDDECLPEALAVVRVRASAAPGRVLMFRMKNGDSLLWANREIRFGNVSTQMVVVPNNPERLGKWRSPYYGGDYWFIRECIELNPNPVEWCQDVIAVHGEAPRPPCHMKRNLLYNVCPFTWNDEWRANVAKLCQFADAFNGRKLVLVRRPVPNGPAMASVDEVRRAFTFDVEIEEIPNSASLWESSGFIGALGSLQSLDPNEATFYAHTKGVRYHGVGSEKLLPAIRKWRDIMYDSLLGDIITIESVLEKHACAGVLRRLIKPEEKAYGWGNWYYSGNFWWVKHSALFSLGDKWRFVRQQPAGVEAYLGDLFAKSEAACLWEDDIKYTPYERFATLEKRLEFSDVVERWRRGEKVSR